MPRPPDWDEATLERLRSEPSYVQWSCGCEFAVMKNNGEAALMVHPHDLECPNYAHMLSRVRKTQKPTYFKMVP